MGIFNNLNKYFSGTETNKTDILEENRMLKARLLVANKRIENFENQTVCDPQTEEFLERAEKVLIAVKMQLAIYDKGRGEVPAQYCLKQLRSIFNDLNTDISNMNKNAKETLNTAFETAAEACVGDYKEFVDKFEQFSQKMKGRA